jgi:hypothetical protein
MFTARVGVGDAVGLGVGVGVGLGTGVALVVALQVAESHGGEAPVSMVPSAVPGLGKEPLNDRPLSSYMKVSPSMGTARPDNAAADAQPDPEIE